MIAEKIMQKIKHTPFFVAQIISRYGVWEHIYFRAWWWIERFKDIPFHPWQILIVD